MCAKLTESASMSDDVERECERERNGTLSCVGTSPSIIRPYQGSARERVQDEEKCLGRWAWRAGKVCGRARGAQRQG